MLRDQHSWWTTQTMVPNNFQNTKECLLSDAFYRGMCLPLLIDVLAIACNFKTVYDIGLCRLDPLYINKVNKQKKRQIQSKNKNRKNKKTKLQTHNVGSSVLEWGLGGWLVGWLVGVKLCSILGCGVAS